MEKILGKTKLDEWVAALSDWQVSSPVMEDDIWSYQSGSKVQLDNGQTVIADDAYVRESILSPTAKIVAGYTPIMPTFQGLVSEEQLLTLIEYVKSLKAPEPRTPKK